MLNRFGRTTDGQVAERTAKCCLLLPSAVGPDGLTLVGKLADEAITLGKGSVWMVWFQFNKGLAEYRQGQFAAALERMQLEQKQIAATQFTSREMCEADTYIVSAMARCQLRQSDEARADLARGYKIAQAKLPKLDGGDLGGGWYDVLMTYILMHEAKEMIEGQTVAK